MNASVATKRTLIPYFDFAYFLKFVLLLLGLYYFNIFYIGLVDPKGLFYSGFCAQYLNYPNWIKAFLLNTSNAFTHSLGFNTYIEGLRKIVIPGRHSLILGMPCVGLNMLIFWTAFVNAHDYTWKKNLLWTIGGIAAICLINCFRITLMTVAIVNRWEVNRYMSHHDLFRLVAYSLIVVLIFLYNRYYTMQKQKPKA